MEWPSYGWTVHAAIIVFLVAYHMGVGPLSWMILVELVPCRAPLEVGIAASSSCWWAFNLMFSMTLIHLAGEFTPIGVPGIFAIHAVVTSLFYAFTLQALPPNKHVHKASLYQIERYFDEKYNKNKDEFEDDDQLTNQTSDVQFNLQKTDLTSVTTSDEDQRSSTST